MVQVTSYRVKASMRKAFIGIVAIFLIATMLSGCLDVPEGDSDYEGPLKVTIKVYDSRNTKNPVARLHLKMAKIGSGISVSTATNSRGTVVFEGYSWLNAPNNYSITLNNNNNWRQVYHITQAERTFTYYVDELPG